MTLPDHRAKEADSALPASGESSGVSASYFVRRLVDHAPSMLAYWDRDLLCRFANRAYELWFGVDPDDLIGRPIAELLGPKLFALNEPYMRAALRGEVQRFERIVPGPDGVQRHSLATYTPDVVDGEVMGFMAQVTDVTPLKQTQAELQATVARLEAEVHMRRTAEETLFDAEQNLSITLASVGAGFIGTDGQGRITRMNAIAERVFEWPEAEARGRILWDVFNRVDRAATVTQMNPIDAMADAVAEQHGFEVMALARTGRQTPLDVHAGFTRFGDGTLRGLTLVFRDLTEQRQSEQKAALYLDELRRSNAELEQFAYVASHDLQEPLRMVAAYTELLATRYKGTLDDKADKYIYFAHDGARRMQQLVADLLAYSRVGSQGKPLRAVAAQKVASRVAALFGPKLDEVHGSLEIGSLPEVMADEGQLEQVLQNLISNALKFRSGAPPRIAVSATRVEEGWRFEVRDNGIGIDERFHHRLFQMFQRLHPVGRYDGSGIGLAIVKRIITRHGGKVWFESTPGQGSTFFFTLQPSVAPSEIS